jgi:hypothetical protein
LEGHVSGGESTDLGLRDSYRINLRLSDEGSCGVGLPADYGDERDRGGDVVGAPAARKNWISRQTVRSQTGEVGDRDDLSARHVNAGGGHFDTLDSIRRLVGRGPTYVTGSGADLSIDEFRYKKYQKVDGVNIPFAVERGSPNNSASSFTVFWKEVKNNVPPNDAMFEKPGAKN